ncbi:MAG: condensation domain-containing protein, partial [Bacteroidales bacterium]|nr:condensation domain-containing protein [Bacteroidales bacterium]
GDPKGVAITHQNVSVFLNWAAFEFKSSAFEVVYASTTYCFDLSVFEIFFSLIAGKTIRILSSALEIPTWIKLDHQVLVNTVPSLLSAIKEDLDQGGFEHLSVLNLAGEQIPQTLIDSIDCDKIEVRNLYGPSEDTTYSTVCRFSNLQKKVLIGHPISNTRIYIVNSRLELIPSGHAGEICISGGGLARGYLFRDELTKEKFIPNPFGSGRLYRTGDLGRWTETGDMEYLGRIDRQVKIRGYRIELGEIETHIRKYPSVDNAAVVAINQNGVNDIVAYIVAKEYISIKDLKRYLNNILPAYMVPLYFVLMDQIPLTLNGKVDVKLLSESGPDLRLDSGETERLNATEEMLSEIWRNVLGIERLSKRDSFFDLGGHSLKALKLVSQINRRFKSDFSLSDIFEYPSIEKFAGIIDLSGNSSNRALVPLAKADFYEVSHAQRRLWILDRVENKSVAYNIPMVYQIGSPLDINALQQAFNALIQKFEPLRTYFVEVDGEPLQGILDQVDFRINVVETNAGENSKDLVQQAITTPFNLGQAPLIKVTLIRKSVAQDCILVINVHHIVLDEWSIDILADHLLLFYDHFSGKNILPDTSIFAPSLVQYKEFAHWHNKQLEENGDRTNEHQNYWLGVFRKPVTCLNLPSDHQRPKIQTFEGKTLAFTLSGELSEGLVKLGSENNATLFMTTLALFNILFLKYTKQNDIVIGTPIANRDLPEMQDQIGFFLNTLALRNQPEPEDSFITFLNKVRKTTLEAFSHQMYPFDMLVDDLQIPRDLSRSPLFDVMLISQTPAENVIKSSGGLSMKPVDYDYPISKFDLSVSYCEDPSGIRYFFEYNTALYESERIQSMFSHFSSLIEGVLANQELPISGLNIVSKEEDRQLMKLSNGCSKILSNNSIVSIIETIALNNKTHPAVVFKRNTLTYETLNATANRLSHFLISQGLNPGDLVCTMLARTEWSVISM